MPGQHRGIFIGGWVSPEAADKLIELSRISGLNKSKALERLIVGKDIPNKSYSKTLGHLAKLGGLLKHEANGHEEIFRIGQQILEITRNLRKQADADNHSKTDQGDG